MRSPLWSSPLCIHQHSVLHLEALSSVHYPASIRTASAFLSGSWSARSAIEGRTCGRTISPQIMPFRASWAILATHEGQRRGVSEVRFQGIVEPHQSHLRVHGGPDGLVELFIYGSRGCRCLGGAGGSGGRNASRQGRDDTIGGIEPLIRPASRAASLPAPLLGPPPLRRSFALRVAAPRRGLIVRQRPIRPEAAAGGLGTMAARNRRVAPIIFPDYASSSAMVTIPSACKSAKVRHACSLRASATRASDLERGYGRSDGPPAKISTH